ncbi:hypothetical protein GIB67_041364 [Kingdonia uniflora]|uniref:DDHD domain-containing protein n=1 Tax=Kingdonia uniflora TaxID=39325 RepID=A0A7J7NIR4_9MAGN|nr:hypothetical protein GIB67_041364 [Kingdonia uniflora]
MEEKSEATCSYGITDSSPDLLKNTPSNIARLEDVIEQSKGRQKYLAQTKSPSDGEDVRWYFCKIPLADNELAASIPQTEIVGKGEYFRFGMRDSLALEASFLQNEDELLSDWWKEYAECSVGPSGSYVSSDTKADVKDSLESNDSNQPYEDEEERVGVPVKGGLYEVDLTKRHCFPVYWTGENRRVLRGHWFARKAGLDWFPLREDIAEQLEFAYRCQVWHRRTFQPSGLFAARVDLPSHPGLHALFTGEDDTWEAWLNVVSSRFSLSLKGNGIKLRRGYSSSGSSKPTQDELRQQKEEEMDDYCSQVPVRHLVFMVHGIGQRLEKANLVDDVGNFRHITASLAEQHLTSFQRDTQRVLYIPCQGMRVHILDLGMAFSFLRSIVPSSLYTWRRSLKLGGETAVEKITLNGVRGLRVMLSATVHDVLYYMSPIYCQEIINSVSSQLNMLYLKFIKRNPGYDGKVSIYGHSLGSVLSYDILCHQDSLSSPFPMEWMYQGREHSEESLLDETNQSSQYKPPIYIESKNSGTSAEKLEGIAVPDKDYELLSEQNIMKQEESTVDPSISSIHSNMMAENEEGFVNPSGILKERLSDLDSTDADSSIPSSDLNNLQDATSENARGKEKLIKILTEEIELLKAKIAELESRCGGEDRVEKNNQGDKEEDLDARKQSLPQKFAIEKDTATKNYRPYIKYTKLEFKVDTFFAVGSPVGVFLALRNIRIGIGKGRDYWEDESISEEIPAVHRMINIFHPFDPVAYRVDPLICKEYINKRPIIIPYHKGGKRLHIGFQEFTEDLAVRSQAVVDHFHSVRVKVLTVCQTRNKDSLEEDAENADEIEERSYGSIMMERLTGSKEGRVDHVLQDKTFEHQYISAIGSHTNYWRDNDTALFILKHLYRDIPEELDSSKKSTDSGSKNKVKSTVGFYQSETIDEELPLTFSDSRIS